MKPVGGHYRLYPHCFSSLLLLLFPIHIALITISRLFPRRQPIYLRIIPISHRHYHASQDVRLCFARRRLQEDEDGGFSCKTAPPCMESAFEFAVTTRARCLPVTNFRIQLLVSNAQCVSSRRSSASPLANTSATDLGFPHNSAF